MKILNGGKKDYYDYLSGIYGIDNDIVYDRVKSHVFRLYENGDVYFIKERLYNDCHKKTYKKYHYVDGKSVYGVISEGVKHYFVLEVGYQHYLFMVERYLDEYEQVQLEPQLIDKFTVTDKKSVAPVSIIPVDYYHLYKESPKIGKYNLRFEIQNPILSGTWITSFIQAEDIYNEIYNYLISIREPNIIDNRNDIQRLESKGFDKKVSFRNPVINANSKKKRK